MRIQVHTKLSQPWDHSSNTFYTHDSNEESLSTMEDQLMSSQSNHPQPLTPNNLYHNKDPHPPRMTLMTTLKFWITPQWATTPPTVNAPPTIPTTIEIVAKDAQQPTQKSNYYQPPLDTNNNNHHWGDTMILPKPLQTFWILSCNVNTLSTKKNYLQWKAASHALAQWEVDVIAIQETNLAWNKIHQQKVQQIFRQPTGHITTATSSSTEISTNSHQWGGTLQALVSSWVSWVVHSGTDSSGLGQLSYLELQGRHNQRFIILSRYHEHMQ